MRFAALGSGSRGNALVVEAGATRILLDCGFGPREVTRRLARLGLVPEDIQAVAVTHEHGDHVGGVAACVRRFGWAVYATHGTASASLVDEKNVRVHAIQGDCRFAVGDLELHPFPVPHDAREPVQYVFSVGDLRLGVLTDVGVATPHMIACLKGCDALVLECNHDAAMLAGGAYPQRLKQRIAGRYGHLENRAAAELLTELEPLRLKHLVAAHLSEENNRPELARAALAEAIGCTADWIGVADQETGFDWRFL
ncbi:MAG TPA: MBL fold metallo-hydrolase [Rhodocyclaceae bacterium]